MLNSPRRYFGNPMSNDSIDLNTYTFKVTYITYHHSGLLFKRILVVSFFWKKWFKAISMLIDKN